MEILPSGQGNFGPAMQNADKAGVSSLLQTSVSSPAKAEAVGATAENRSGRELRVYHLIGALRYGGAERQVVNLLNELPFAVRCIMLGGRPMEEGLDHCLDPEVARLPLRFRLRRFPVDLVRRALFLRRAGVDVLHTHMFWASLFGAIAGRLAGVPVIITTEHGHDLWWKAWWHRWLERRVITPLVDCRVCVSEEIRQTRVAKEGVAGEKLICIPNGTVMPDRWGTAGGADGSPPLIGSLGRFVEAKDYLNLIAAAARLRDAGVAFRLSLLGDGPERSAIEQAVTEHGLESVVELPGFQADSSAWLQQFQVFVMSSAYEGQPMALLEAMAHGLPIVATAVGGIPQTIENGREALLVPPKDPGALAEALQVVLTDPEKRRVLGQNARQRVEREFSIQAIAARYAGLYQQLWTEKCGNPQ